MKAHEIEATEVKEIEAIPEEQVEVKEPVKEKNGVFTKCANWIKGHKKAIIATLIGVGTSALVGGIGYAAGTKDAFDYMNELPEADLSDLDIPEDIGAIGEVSTDDTLIE